MSCCPSAEVSQEKQPKIPSNSARVPDPSRHSKQTVGSMTIVSCSSEDVLQLAKSTSGGQFTPHCAAASVRPKSFPLRRISGEKLFGLHSSILTNGLQLASCSRRLDHWLGSVFSSARCPTLRNLAAPWEMMQSRS